MPISISDNFNIQIAQPIDARVNTNTLQSRDASELGKYYEGLITFVKANKLLYVLTNTGSAINLSLPLNDSPNYTWKQIATTDMVLGGGGNTFATMSIGGVNILADSPSGSVFIASGSFGGAATTNNNLLISASAGNDTITFSLVDSPTFTDVTASNALITNNLVVGGRVTAQEFHTELVSASIIYESGSTQFGNSSDDTHIFTGSLRQSGSDSYFLGNVGIGTISPSAKLDVSGSTIIRGALTSSIISASSWISGSDLRISNTSTIGGTLGVIGETTLTGRLQANGAITTTNITASGNISSSLGLIGQTLTISDAGTIGGLLSANGGISTTTITASGNISSSGNLSITGTSTLTGNSTIGGTLGVTGLLSANGGISTTTINASGDINTSAGLIGQTLTISGNSTISGVLTANDVRISQTLIVSGSTILGDASTTEDTLTINSPTSIKNNNLDITGSLFVNGNTKLGSNFANHNVTVESNKIFSLGAASGFTGNGWMITRNAGNTTTLDIDNIYVRGTLSATTFLAQQIRATNGSVYVSSTGRVNSTSSLGTDSNNSQSFGLVFETGSGIDGHGFESGDVIRAQRTHATNTSLTSYKSDMIVRSVQSTSILTASLMSGSSEPQFGYDYVRLGNTASISNRRGTVYLTSDDSNAPYIDVVDGVQSHQDWGGGADKIKVRMGNLAGMTSQTFGGALNGYGLYASGSAYLEGGINATVGLIAGWNISSSKIEKRNIELNSDQSFARFGDGVTLTQNKGVFLSGSGEIMIGNASNKRISFINNDLYINSTNFTLQNGNITASNATLSGTITANAGRIGGFAITQDAITGSAFFLSGSATGNGFFISASNFNVKANGQVTGSNVLFTGGKVGGFNLSSDAISGAGFFLSGSATGNDFFISSSNFNVKANGTITASNATLSGTITANAGTIGGWRITDSQISSSGIILTTSSAEDNNAAILMGNATNLNTGSGIFLNGKGYFRVGNPNGKRIRWDSGDLLISSSNFTLINGNITASNATLSGTITANAGRIGGFAITQDAITGSAFFLSGSATGDGFFISASNFNVKANGQLTGSNVLFTGGKVGGFNLSSDAISGAGFFLSGSATGDGFFISASNFNVKANGTITASAGLIGGFNTTSDKIESTGSFTSGSFTSPYISLKANGQITGSDVLLRRLHSDGKVYNHFDTTTGIIDARNIGRQVVQHYNGMTLVGGTNNVWYESSDCYYPIQLLQGENALLISFSLLGQTGNGSAPEHNAKITLSSASFSSTIVSDNSLFDNWGGEIDVLQKSFNSVTGTKSQVITPSGSGAVVSIPESYQGKYCLLKLELMQSSAPGSTTTTAVRGLTITTTRTFAANVASGSGFTVYQEKYNL